MISNLGRNFVDIQFWFYGFAIVTLMSFWGALLSDQVALVGIPFLLVFVLILFSDPKKIFYLFFAILPFSIEIELPGGLGTDLPSEPVMIILTGIYFCFLLVGKIPKIKSFITHPITLILFLHLVWIAFTCFFAENQLFAFKFLLAKIWYVVPFYFLPICFLKSEDDHRSLIKIFLIALCIAVVYVMVRHASLGFTFKSINEAGKPIFRNHVNYAAILALSLPYMWYVRKASKRTFLWSLAILFILTAVYLTYTRAAYIVVLASIAGYLMIQFRLTLMAILLSIIVSAGYIWYNYNEANYLELAPNYERTVAHYKFDNLVEATYKMEDISTMERLYRWVAGFQMVQERPLLGFGPSNFYTNYQDYSVSSFQTYVSDNPEKSGIHNNYLMVMVEQGIPGFIIMMILALFPLVYGERLYHMVKNIRLKRLLMASILSFLAIDIFIIINDLLEADKVGPFYFLNLAVLVFVSLKK